MHNPDLILMDEPFSGLDVGSALVLRSLIQELAVRVKVILFSSHELETVERICSHVVILHRGKIVADDSIERPRTLMALAYLKLHFGQHGLSHVATTAQAVVPFLIVSIWMMCVALGWRCRSMSSFSRASSFWIVAMNSTDQLNYGKSGHPWPYNGI